MSNQQRSFLFNVDLTTIGIYLALCIIGWFNIHAAVFDPENPSIFDLGTNYGKQLMFICSALVLGAVILLLDSKFFTSLAPLFYGVTVLLLVAVLVVGRNVGGNQAWIPIGSFRLQPSEFAKFSTCLLLARYLSASGSKIQDFKTQIITIFILVIPMGLIMLQPDTGSTL
ncbi:MAG TPA: rod shape-determining protein RodA, partial [Sphingobacteriaceae bacterium]